MIYLKPIALLVAIASLVGISSEVEARSRTSVSIGFGAGPVIAPAPVYVQPVERRVVYREAVVPPPGCYAPVAVAPAPCVECVPVYEEVYARPAPVVYRERVAVRPSFGFGVSWRHR